MMRSHKDSLQSMLALALMEDAPGGDITTLSLVSSSQKARARIITKTDGVFCGTDVIRGVFHTFDKKMRIKSIVADGTPMRKGQVLVEISGQARAIVTGERVALNLASHLSGIATITRAFVDAIKPYPTSILDTRKTMPLWRSLERYAVRKGGGVNHRLNLTEMAMIKDNHLLLANKRMSLKDLVNAIKAQRNVPVELEIDHLKQMPQALASGADVILLDNMPPKDIQKAVQLRNTQRANVLLEASGGIHLKNVRAFAATGVDRISIGALTHSRPTIDLSLEIL